MRAFGGFWALLLFVVALSSVFWVSPSSGGFSTDGLPTEGDPPPSGRNIVTVAGGGNGDDGPARFSTIGDVQALAYGPDGALYAADRMNCQVRRILHGTIATVAGTGLCGFSGDGGPAVLASLNGPEGIAVGPGGEIYISDTRNCRIRRVFDGMIDTVAGTGICGYYNDNGPALSSGLNHPRGLAATSSGEIIVADTGNCRIRKLTSGVISRIAGNGACGSSGDGGSALQAGISAAEGVAVDLQGAIWIADTTSDVVRKVTSGVINRVGGGGGAGGDGGSALSAYIYGPESIAVDPSGNAYITETPSNRVRRIDPAGIISTFVGDGTIIVAGEDEPQPSSIRRPAGVAVGLDGQVVVGEAGLCRVREAKNGTVSVVVGSASWPHLGCNYGGDGGPALRAALGFWLPDLDVDESGRIYVGDALHNRIRGIWQGTIDTVLGGDPYNPISDPIAFEAVDESIYLVQRCTIQRVRASLTETVAGDGRCYYVEDGVSAASTGFDEIKAMDIAPDGTIWVSSGCRLRTITGGIVQTAAGIGVCGSSGDGGPASLATTNPLRLRSDGTDGAYLLEESCAIRHLSEGVLTTVLNGCARDFDFDAAGRLYLAFDCEVATWADGVQTIVAGASCGYSGDGGDPLQASIVARAIEVTDDGDIYIAGGYQIGESPDGELRSAGVVRLITANPPVATPTIVPTSIPTASPTSAPEPTASATPNSCEQPSTIASTGGRLASPPVHHGGGSHATFTATLTPSPTMPDGTRTETPTVTPIVPPEPETSTATAESDSPTSTETSTPTDVPSSTPMPVATSTPLSSVTAAPGSPCTTPSPTSTPSPPAAVSVTATSTATPCTGWNTDATPLDNGPVVPGNDATILNGDAIVDGCDPDDDNDGLQDSTEQAHPVVGCSAASGPIDAARIDTDGDHLVDGWECFFGTDPLSPSSSYLGSDGTDADDDRIPDFWERRGYNGSAVSVDSDADGCHDLVELASIDTNKTVGDADRLSVTRRALGLWPSHRTQDYVLDIDKNGVVGDTDRLFVARAALLPDWLPKSCP
jgi:sugar lactone lactonase YvrE